MMNWDAIGAVGEVGGAVAVVASLIYLAAQVRSNTNSVEASSLQSVIEGCRERTIMPMYLDPDVADLAANGMSDFESLNDTDKRRFYSFMYEQAFQMQNVLDLYKRRQITEVDYLAWLQTQTAMMQTPGGRIAWQHIRRTLTPTVRDTMQGYMDEHPDQETWLDLNPLYDTRQTRNDT